MEDIAYIKTRKPTATDMRPIALLNVSYKLFMSIIKSKTESYLKECGIYTDLQAGFTEKEERQTMYTS